VEPVGAHEVWVDACGGVEDEDEDVEPEPKKESL
jgi:hypothetical protein